MQKYINSLWNLNNLATADQNILRYLGENINDLLTPWLYIGMCFATSCWRTEDNYTYLINYNHYGEPKTWYGIPGEKAQVFEKAMVKIAPELFYRSPDLLHRLVTTCNPTNLINMDVPVSITI